MKKKRRSKSIYVLFFAAALFFSIYIINEFHYDYLAVAGAGAVLLISVYFLVDKFEHDRSYEREEINIEKEYWHEKLEKIEKSQRAIYAALKKGTVGGEGSSKDYTGQLEQLKNTVNAMQVQQERIFKALKIINDTQKSGFNAVVKYDKENAENVASAFDKGLCGISDSIKEGNESIKRDIAALDLDNVQVDTSSLDAKYDELSQAMLQNLVTITESMDSMYDAISELKKEKISNAALGEAAVSYEPETANKYETVEEAAEIPSEEIIEEAVEVPSEEIIEEAVEIPLEEIIEETVEVPSEEITEEAEEIPSEEIIEEAEEIPSEEIMEEAEEIPSEEITEEAEEIPSEEIIEEAEEIPSEEIMEEAVEIPSEEIIENVSEDISIDDILAGIDFLDEVQQGSADVIGEDVSAENILQMSEAVTAETFEEAADEPAEQEQKTELKQEEEKPVNSDPNKALSPEEIAALFASINN